MRRLTLVSALAALLGACEKEPDIDMSYRVSVEWQENTCEDATPWPPVRGALIDIVLRGDGAHDIYIDDPDIPGTWRYESVNIGKGFVHRRSDASSRSGAVHVQTVSGKVSEDSVDLIIENTADLWDMSDPERYVYAGECVRKVRLLGEPRKLEDPAVPDGKYRVRFNAYDRVCEGEEPEPKNDLWLTLDVSPHGDGTAMLVFDRSVYFESIPLSETSTVDWNGTAYISENGWLNPVDARLYGNLDGRDMSLVFDLKLASDQGCPYRYSVEGVRRPPSKESIDNDYAMSVTMTGDCSEIVPFAEKRIEIITQADGSLIMRDADRLIPLEKNAEGGYSITRENSIQKATYSMVADSPRLDYSIVESRATFVGWCTKITTASGHARYVR